MFDRFIEPGVPHVVFWVFIGAAIIIQGIGKSGFAGGAGVLSLPLMMLVMPPHLVSATLLPILILCDIGAVYQHRHNKVWKKVMEIYLPSLAGIALGGLVWWKMGRDGIEHYERPIKVFVGVIAVIFTFYLFAKETAMGWVGKLHLGKKCALFSGVSAGFCSTIIHAAGPIVSLHVFAQGLGKSLFVGTVAWIFTLINLTKLPIFLAVGLIDHSVLTFDAVLIPLIPIGTWLGKWMYQRASDRVFIWVIMALTLVTAIQLLFDIQPIQWVLEHIAP